MAKIIQSPLPGYPGFVVLSDPLSIEQVICFQESVEAARGETDVLKIARALLPGVCACVECWSVAGVEKRPTAGDFPMGAASLIVTLMMELTPKQGQAEDGG